ncbi:hypothetical protein DEF24_10780 [Marinitenerispora sediminis]|uniref:Uncharacterized protein n=1 Tax=Marinitenerispora sediminis TaxID=1931232 RepID=A0A368T633_9ACTN|nr:hypothetical protein DEF24_10780 [Marinitenerispora sediminis]
MAHLASLCRLGGYQRGYRTPGAAGGVLVAAGTLVGVILVEVLLIVFTDHYVVGGFLFFAVVYAFVHMFRCVANSGTAVHLFADGLVQTSGGTHTPVHFGAVTALRVRGKGHRELARVNAPPVRLTAFLRDSEELFQRLGQTALQRRWPAN